MPSFLVDPKDYTEILEADGPFDVDFEVWCGTCGAGLCNQSTTDARRAYRGGHHVFVDACERCLERAIDQGHDDAVEEMRSQIEALEAQVRDLKTDVRDLEIEIDRLSSA